MKTTRSRKPAKIRRSIALICLTVCVLAGGCNRKPGDTLISPPPTVAPVMVNPWKEAARQVEQERGEPVGRKAKVTVPEQLKHYSDRTRFLALQVAEARQQKFTIPHDYAELVALVRQGQLVEMEPLGQDYILYGVGGNATDDSFHHYDRATSENIPLFAADEEFNKLLGEMADSVRQADLKITELQKELKQVKKRDKANRKLLLGKVAEARKARSEVVDRKELLDSFYKNPARRKALEAEYRAIADLAADFDGKSYDLSDGQERRNLKIRLLSFLRPEARSVVLEIARSYKEKFDRPLPITSLVRPEQYQRHLGETNPNATAISLPPHSSGLAFDVYYYYMTAAEQDYLMGTIARLESDGRVEALRENRNHIHVFAFAGGKPPDETLVANASSQLGRGKAGAKVDSRAKARSKPLNASAARKSKKRVSQVAAGRS